jgi:hypothetical protein
MNLETGKNRVNFLQANFSFLITVVREKIHLDKNNRFKFYFFLKIKGL